MISNEARSYLAQIGRIGGRKSRRRLSASDARRMVAVRLARQAYREFRTSCFWSYRDLTIDAGNVDWVAGQLRRNGNRSAWRRAGRIQSLLCP